MADPDSAEGGTVSDTRVFDKDGEEIVGAVRNPDGSVTLTLEKPVHVMGTQHDTLTFRKNPVEDFEALDKKGGGRAVTQLLARSANVPPDTIRELDGADYVAGGHILNFFTRKRRTGTSS